MSVTFKSNVLVGDSSTPTSRFTEFSIQPESAQALEQLRDESEAAYALSFVGSGVRAAHALLKSLEARGLMNGEPSVTMDGYRVAVARAGELVTLEAPVYQRGAPDDKEVITRTGIITNVVWAASAGPLGQRLDLVFHACHRLHIRTGGVILTLTDPAASA